MITDAASALPLTLAVSVEPMRPAHQIICNLRIASNSCGDSALRWQSFVTDRFHSGEKEAFRPIFAFFDANVSGPQQPYRDRHSGRAWGGSRRSHNSVFLHFKGDSVRNLPDARPFPYPMNNRELHEARSLDCRRKPLSEIWANVVLPSPGPQSFCGGLQPGTVLSQLAP